MPLANLGVDAGRPAYLNLWVDPGRGMPRQAESLALLTSREREIALYALGHTARDVAEIASISVHTARDHRDHIYAKLGIRSRAELATVMLPAGR